MLNRNGDGIVCDYCGSEHNGDFVYFSFDFKENKVIHKFRREYKTVLSADMCQECMRLYNDRLKQVADVVLESERRCDVTGADMGLVDHIYYRCYVARVTVSIENQPFKCLKCEKVRMPDDGPCEDCEENTKLKRDASLDVDHHHVVLNFSEQIFSDFKDHLERMKKSGTNEWTNA